VSGFDFNTRAMPTYFSFRRAVLASVAIIAVGLLVFWFSDRESTDALQSSNLAETVPPLSLTDSTGHTTTAFDPTSQRSMSESPSVRRLQDHDEWLREIVAQLIALDDTRSLVAAAAIMHAYAPVFRDPSTMRSEYAQRILDLMERATAQAPADPVVAIMADAYCLKSTAIECDSAAFDRTLQTSDPENALAWIGSLEQAKARDDRAQQERIVREMARAKRVDTHYLDIENLLTRTIESVRVPIPDSMVSDPVNAARALAANTLRAVPKLTLAPLGAVCRHPIDDALLAACQRVIDLVRDEQGNLPTIALSIATQLSRSGSAESQALAETQRRRAWQFMKANRLPRTSEQTQRIAGGDSSAAVEVLIANAAPLDPPKDWMP